VVFFAAAFALGVPEASNAIRRAVARATGPSS
jgi:hypothetical protein